jgi:hypothetical protein
MSNAFGSMPNAFGGGCVHSHHTCAHLHATQLQFEPLLTKIHAVLAELWFNHWTGLCEFNYCNSHTGSSLENYHPTCVQDIHWAHCRQDKEGFTMFKTNICFTLNWRRWPCTQPPPNTFDMCRTGFDIALMLSALIHLCTKYYAGDCVWIPRI